MEKEYIFFDTGKGCLLAMVLSATTKVALGFVFSLIPQSWWLQVLIALPAFVVVTHFVFAVDKKSKTK